MQDIRYALRTLRKQPIFTLVAVLTLTLGIGANTAIFSLLYQLLLRPLPYAHADRLMFLWNSSPLMGLPQEAVSIPDYLDRRAQAPAVEDATLFSLRAFSLTTDGQPEQLRGLLVTPSFFSTLGRQPFIGRAFTDDEAKVGADKYVVLTYGTWATHFGSDRSIVGRDVRINGEPYRVTGVMPADVELPAVGAAMLVPYAFTPAQMSDAERGNEFSQMIARLRPGATIDQVNAQMRAIIARNAERLPQSKAFWATAGFTGYAVTLRDQLVGDTRASVLVLQAGVLAVLLIACANVASLLLMRATGRARELAIRTTMGAGRWRLVRQLLTEGLVLAFFGAAGGLALGLAGVRGLVALSTRQIPGMAGASINPAVLIFTTVLAIVTGLVFGLVPAITVMRGNTNALLKEDTARGSAGKSTGAARATLVVSETALALILLVGAGLLIKSFAHLQEVNPGFSADNVLTAQIALPATRYPNDLARRIFWTRLLERVQALSGVTSVGLTSNVPFNGNVGSGSYSIVGYTPPQHDAQPHGRQEVVGGDYFRAMQIPLVAGRFFSDSDTADSSQVVVIDQLMVKRYFADKDPIGQQIRRAGPTSPAVAIVGVVGTINAIDLGEPVTKERLYYPVTQIPTASMGIVVKTRIDPKTLASQVRTAVTGLDPEQPIADVRTMDEWMARSLEGRRAPTLLLSLFGIVALTLSAIGIYGVLAFGVAQRSREFGIRQALGANSSAILSLVLVQGMRTTVIGIVLGLAGAVALTRYLQSFLFGVDAHDVTVYAGVTALLLAVALMACYLPALRATRVAPTVALRDS